MKTGTSPEVLDTPTHLLVSDENAAFLFTYRNFGNVAIPYSEDGDANRLSAAGMISDVTGSTALVRMKTAMPEGAVYLDVSDVTEDDLPEVAFTEALITTNPEHILQVNPADCLTLTVNGQSDRLGKQVLTLIHAAAKDVVAERPIATLEYICKTYDMDPKDLVVKASPSARHQTYKFPDISAHQKESERWGDYVYQDEDGLWHVDFHGRAMTDLTAVGIRPENVWASPDDTIADPTKYFSYYRHVQQGDTRGYNGAFAALMPDRPE